MASSVYETYSTKPIATAVDIRKCVAMGGQAAAHAEYLNLRDEAHTRQTDDEESSPENDSALQDRYQAYRTWREMEDMAHSEVETEKLFSQLSRRDQYLYGKISTECLLDYAKTLNAVDENLGSLPSEFGQMVVKTEWEE